ncbi:hypothetical protein AUJ14_03280 [Candidatus Micrarchaeota archaeon CG1_02_55_22]|nr:MAG: hypothetical protein AUJ14_03280 [Candidatus Micrarchaeota archaeon CG1_02_55_22]
MPALTDSATVTPRHKRVLVLASQGEIVNGALHNRFELLAKQHGKGHTAIDYSIITPFTDAAASSGVRENELASAAAGVPVYSGESGYKFFLTSGFHSHVEDVARFCARNEELFGIDSSEWAAGEQGRRAASDAYALYAAGTALLEAAQYNGVIAVGWPAFPAALRLSQEHGVRAACEFTSTPTVRQAESLTRQSHEDAALARAHAVIAGDPARLSGIISAASGRVVNLDKNPDVFASLVAAHRTVALVRQKRGLEHLVRHSSASTEERRAAVNHVKQISLELSGANEFRVDAGKAMGLGSGLARVNYSIPERFSQLAAKRAATFKALSGKPLGRHANTLYASCRSAKTVSTLLSSLSFTPESTALLLEAGEAAQLATQKASLLSVSSRVVLLPAPDAGAMTASQALFFGSHASGLENYSTAIGISAASESDKGPIILCTGNAPLALHGHEILLSSPPSIANSLEKAFHDSGYRERLKQSAQRVASAGWDWESHATAYDSFVSNAFD